MRFATSLLILLPALVQAQHLPKIHLHTDREAYFPGDTIWFKSYVLTDGLPDKSNNLYINFGDGDGKVSKEAVMLLQKGMSEGHYVVPSTNTNPFLWLNAFTKSIAKEPSAYYTKAIPLIQMQDQQAVVRLASPSAVKAISASQEADFSQKLTVEFSEKSKEAKGKNTFSIKLPEGETASLSIAITDIQVGPDTLNNILRDILIKATEKESKLGASVPFQADSLLFLRGKIEMPDNKWTKFYQRYLKLSSNNKKMGARGQSFGYKEPPARSFIYKEVFADAQGKFDLHGFSYYDSLDTKFSQIYPELKFDEYKIQYQFSDLPKQTVLSIDAAELAEVSARSIQPQHTFYGTDFYLDSKGVRHIREISISRSKLQRSIDAYEQKFVSGLFKAKADVTLLPHTNKDVLKRSMSLRDYLAMNLRRNGFGALYHNERLISDKDMINEVLDKDMSTIAYIKYFEQYAGNNNARTTLVYELAAQDVDRDFGRIIDEQTVSGYLRGKPFENRIYATADEALSSPYDYRATLYWNPAATGAEPITFYNNSRAQGFWVTIQGITSTGKIVFYQQKFDNK